MPAETQLTSQLKQIQNSYIQFSSYDPTTYYLNDQVFDRDAFKKLKKEGLVEIDFESKGVKYYKLSRKALDQINLS